MPLHTNRREILLVLGTCLFTCSVLVPFQLRFLQANPETTVEETRQNIFQVQKKKEVGTSNNHIEEEIRRLQEEIHASQQLRQEIRRLQEEIHASQQLRRMQEQSKQGMLGTDVSVHPASIGRFWADLSSATATQSSTHAHQVAGRAINGNIHNAAHTSRGHSQYWQVSFQAQLKFTGLEVLFRQKGSVYQAPPIAISVDGVECGVITEFDIGIPKFVQFSTPCYGTSVRISPDPKQSVYLLLYDVKIEVETSGEDDVQNVAAIICPFLSTLVFHHVLRGCVHTNETLLEATLGAGLEESKARAHIMANFRNIPSGRQDICNMEGAPNEHITSTGCCDCETFFTSCQQNHSNVPASCKATTLEKTCGAPNATKFENFWKKCKDGDTSPFLTKAELNDCESKVDFNDGNPIGLGTISGSFGLLIDIFGHNGAIHKFILREVILQRRFPPGYQYGRMSDCDCSQMTLIPNGHPGAGTRVCCPKGQTKFGDGSACRGGGRPDCKTYGNRSLPLCSTVAAQGVSLC